MKKMSTTISKQGLSLALSYLLTFSTFACDALGQQLASTGYSGQHAPSLTDELQQLVVSIALYPDTLIAQILGAATFPDQVGTAVRWTKRSQ
jgi:hypothetical protein